MDFLIPDLMMKEVIAYETVKRGWSNLEFKFCGDVNIIEPFDIKSAKAPKRVPVFGGQKTTLSFDKLTVCGVWRSNGKGEVSVMSNFKGEFLGKKSEWAPSETGMRDALKKISDRFSHGKYSYCKVHPNLCMHRGRYMGTLDVSAGGSGDLTYRNQDHQLIID